MKLLRSAPRLTSSQMTVPDRKRVAIVSHFPSLAINFFIMEGTLDRRCFAVHSAWPFLCRRRRMLPLYEAISGSSVSRGRSS